VHSSTSVVAQLIPESQSASLVHGSGEQVVATIGSQGGHSAPSAQSIAGQVCSSVTHS
jgi:hypothetical protein